MSLTAVPSIAAQLVAIRSAAGSGWISLERVVAAAPRNDLVSIAWDVIYDKLGHDMLIDARVKLTQDGDALLQTWLKIEHPGIWIPQLRPWVASVVEFAAEDSMRKAHVGLVDSKWRREDAGQTYRALLWGYVQHGTTVEAFGETRDFVYPG